ncbi:MAG TPA: TonB-dependent receptor [Patescibacteria group bacterium]|nr:TonB-dependent receptor [Patescibacteria group bacterium]
MRIVACVAILTAGLIAAASRPAMAQTNTANLTGRVLNPKGLGVAGARVRIVSQSTGMAKETTTDSRGGYFFLALPPGVYQFTVLAKAFATLLNRSLTLATGRREVYNVTLQVRTQEQTVTGEPASIETTRSSNEVTITASQINDLPINRRDYILFALLSSQVKSDNTPLAGAIPTSGLDFNGQRARGNEVMVDGADAIDEATGGIRSTVSQEAVRDFQVEENNYMPEYGRAIGGAINIDTKSGSNEMHGDLFGYFRNSRIQARDPFSDLKQPYTRVQGGGTLGGHLQQGKMFYFLSAEALRTEATGFSSIGQGNFQLTPATVPCLSNPVLMTADQAAFFNSSAVQNAITTAGGCGSQAGSSLAEAESLYGASSTTALNGNTAAGPTSFPLPVDCSGSGCTSGNVVPLPQDYVGLSSLVGNYPTTQKTEIGSARLDRIWNQNQRSFLRFSISPSYQSGIQLNVPGQNVGLNAGTRGSVQHFQDIGGEGHHLIALSSTLLNETMFQYARRSFHYGYSPLTGGSNVGVNIPGYAFFGSEPLSTLDSMEKLYELADNVTWVHGNHTIKFGVDVNYLQLSGAKNQLFNLNYGGAYNFGSLDAASVPYAPLSQLSQQLGKTLPSFTGVQAYGLGIPQSFLQGIGQSSQAFDDRMLGGFWQDSWRVTSRLTVNYGVRYDVAFTPVIAPAISSSQMNINQAAESALKVGEGIPTDYKDIAPRLGLAWDPTGSGKTVVRAGFGLYYGVTPLTAVYDSAATDGVLSTQLQVPMGSATGVAVSPSTELQTQAMNASSLFQGVLGGIPTIPSTGAVVCGTNLPANLGYECGQQRFNATLSGSVFSNQNYLAEGLPMPILPFTLPVANNFVSMYSEQGTLALEHEFPSNLKVKVSYSFVRGLHLYRPRNINQANAVLLTQNFANALAAGLPASSPLTVQVPLTTGGGCTSTSGTTSYQVSANASGDLAMGFNSPNCKAGTAFGYIGTAAVFNDFRPSGPNPSYGGANLAGYSQLVSLASEAGFPTGYGTPVAWSDVSQLESTGASLYNGLTVTVSKSFSNQIEMFSSWTWSHARDNTTDLSMLEEPQNNDNPNLAWGNSSFDQRHRWITSAIIESPYSGKQKGFLKRLLENSFAAPIIDFASGRPYSVLTGTDYNLNFNSYTDRPSVVSTGTAGSATSPYIPGVAFSLPTVCAAGIPASIAPYGCNGNLGRNTFVTPKYFDIDLRIDKKFYIGDTKNFEFIAEGFNLLNRFNVLAVNQICDPAAGSTCMAGQPTAAFNPREFQFALKFNF